MRGRPRKDLVGERFGRLVVESHKGMHKFRRVSQWQTRCDCGNMKVVVGKDLQSGNVKSCGCLAKEKSRVAGVKHGQSFTKTYRTWLNMMHRARNKKDKYYAGRGIGVCNRWEKFENFLSDMGEQPNNHWIERIDNERGYSPENCCWATPKEQAQNRRPRSGKGRDEKGRFA